MQPQEKKNQVFVGGGGGIEYQTTHDVELRNEEFYLCGANPNPNMIIGFFE